MLRFLARRWAKIQNIFHAETEAANNDLNARLALSTAAEKRKLISALILRPTRWTRGSRLSPKWKRKVFGFVRTVMSALDVISPSAMNMKR
jgi:hypothetical protein